MPAEHVEKNENSNASEAARKARERAAELAAKLAAKGKLVQGVAPPPVIVSHCFHIIFYKPYFFYRLVYNSLDKVNKVQRPRLPGTLK